MSAIGRIEAKKPPQRAASLFVRRIRPQSKMRTVVSTTIRSFPFRVVSVPVRLTLGCEAMAAARTKPFPENGYCGDADRAPLEILQSDWSRQRQRHYSWLY